MENQKNSIIARLKQAKNVLVTVSNNPSVDQLAAAIATTLAINKSGMRANAVFSGQTPSTLDFLKPEDILDKNTDALRDFIISLDKAKADKLRYKVEDNHVKIFITPYKTSLTQEDLDFEQGDFNVDVVLALGVKEKSELDNAITAQGRILHDATIIDINNVPGSSLGTLIWTNEKASSLCEMTLSLVTELKNDVLDEQIATAFLTGIVAETERFSNEKTTSEVMQASGQLMSAGANQQLIASKLQEPQTQPEPNNSASTDGSVELPELQKQATDPNQTLEKIEKSVSSPHADQSAANSDSQNGPNQQAASGTTQPAVSEEPAEKKDDDGTMNISHTEKKDNEAETEDAKADEEEKVAEIHIDDQGHFYPDGAPKEPAQPSSQQVNQTTTPPSESETRGMSLTPPTLGGQLTANSEREQTPPAIDVMGAGKPDRPMLNRDKTASKPTNSAAEQPQPPQTLQNLEQAVESPHLDSNQNTPVPSPEETKTPSSPPQQTTNSQPTQPQLDENLPPAVPPPMMPPVEPPPDNGQSGAL